MEALDQAEGLIAAKLGMIKTFITLVKLEARLAGLSVFPLLVTVILLLVILMSVWMLAMLMMGYAVMLFVNNIFICLAVVLLVNVLSLLLSLYYLTVTLRRISFEKTRQYLSSHKKVGQ